MANEKEMKTTPVSLRITEETQEKFRQIARNIGGNQQETMAKLIEAYEFQAGKAVLTDKRSDIEQFERYVNALTRMYMGSLEDNQNITQTVRADYDAQLKSKDAIIQDLQARVSAYKQTSDAATQQAAETAEINEELQTQIKELTERYTSKMENLQSMLSDKDSLNKALTDTVNDLKAKVEALEQAAGRSDELQAELESVKQERDRLAGQQADHERQIESVKLEYEKAALNTERSYQDQIQGLKEEKQAKIDKYQQKYEELLDRLNGTEK